MNDQLKDNSNKRTVREAEVLGTEWLTPGLVRVFLTGKDLVSIPPLHCTDHYIKFFFPPAGADYTPPFDPEQMRNELPREEWPVTRTYTIRSFDRESNVMTVDFVVHGDDGLAGSWAARVAPGALINFRGPGGKFVPDSSIDSHLLVGDEAAMPAIAATLEALPDTAVAEVFLEVEDGDHELDLPTTSRTTIHWIHRGGLSHGVTLAEAVRNAPRHEGTVQAFVHGNAHMVKDLRRFLFVECGLEKSQVSISGYWRTDFTEDAWQASKAAFVAAMEEEEAAARAR
ncbi:MAG: siderophore-interacting protein [Propionibacteriaceae bacterium]|nr:siderophore-interacting protein [Propionibacteriaceae bacterium]